MSQVFLQPLISAQSTSTTLLHFWAEIVSVILTLSLREPTACCRYNVTPCMTRQQAIMRFHVNARCRA